MKVLLPALAGGAVPMLAAEGTALAIEGGAVVADKSAIGADEEVAGEATAPSGAVCAHPSGHFVESRLAPNPVESRVLSTPTR